MVLLCDFAKGRHEHIALLDTIMSVFWSGLNESKCDSLFLLFWQKLEELAQDYGAKKPNSAVRIVIEQICVIIWEHIC